MKNRSAATTIQSKNIIRILLGTGLILLVPLVAMQFSDDVDWDLTDFIAMGTLLAGTGLVYEFTVSKVQNPKYRIAIGALLLAVLLVIWAELAVGIFGTPFAGS